MKSSFSLLVLLGSIDMVTSNIVGMYKFKRVCYFTNWAQYREQPMGFSAENIDPFLCTHIVYAFSQLENNSLATTEWNDLAQYGRVTDMKTINPNLKIILGVGGWNHGVERFSAMASSDKNIEEFATSATSFLRKYNFDGLDLDWEFPAYGQSDKVDKFRFSRLTQILRKRFDEEGVLTQRVALLLSAAVSAVKSVIDAAYEVDIISRELDIINLMSYDLHGSWEATTGHSSPLHARGDEQGNQRYLNQCRNTLTGGSCTLSLGAPPNKLVMGMALYGRTFTLANTGNVGLGAPTLGAGVPGLYTTEAGFMGYYEICKHVDEGWTRVWDDEHKVPYAFYGDQWVGYDDVESFVIKAEFIRAMGLAGSMVWAVDLDDFNNVCGHGVNPLTTTLKNMLEYQVIGPETDRPLPDTTSTQTPVTLVTSDPPTEVKNFKRVCYFTNWAQYRSWPMRFTADNIDPFLCTHIIYAFSQLNGNSMTTVEWNDITTYNRVMDWKVTNPNLKVLLAVGGYNHGVERFSDMASSNQTIDEFAANAISFLRSHQFDGLDIDWEYPAYKTSGPDDKSRFTTLIEILRREFDLEGGTSNQPVLLLTAAVSASKNRSDAAYEIDIISQHLDFINLMSYDFHGGWDNTTGHNSPLFARQNESTDQQSLNQDAAVRYWISEGAPPYKLIMGLALYGRSFTLASPTDVGLGADTAGVGNAGQYTRADGFMAYYEVCDLIKNKGWTRVWDDEHQVPFAYSGDQWVGYDDIESFTMKAQYIRTQGLGGSMVWAMDLDDFNNVCGLGSNPLMSVLKTDLPPTGPSTLPGPPTDPSIRPDATRQQTGNTTTADDSTTSGPSLQTTSNSQTNCGPTQCVDSVITPSVCDKACVFQCCNGSQIEYCCKHGFVWNDANKNCQLTMSTTTSPTTVSTKPNCDAPAQCNHGGYIPNRCDDQCYYRCSFGVAFRYCCAAGTLWDNNTKRCDFPKLIQNNPNCRPNVCPPAQFLPDRCAPECYYQCTPAGLGVRYCCGEGTLWDDSIKTCIISPVSDQGEILKVVQQPNIDEEAESDITTHQIEFKNCSGPTSFSQS